MVEYKTLYFGYMEQCAKWNSGGFYESRHPACLLAGEETP